MNKNFQAQILSAMLVLSAASTTVVPVFAADNGNSTTVVTTSVQKNDQALMESIGVLLNANDIKGAYEAVDKALQANSQNATAYLCKSWVLYADYMDLNRCLEPINQAIAIAPDYIDAHMSKASVLKTMNDWRGAAKEYDVVISLDPTNESAMNSSIACKADLGDWSGLVENFKIQIANDPTNAMAYFNKAYCEAKLGARDAAIADYQEAEKLFVAANDTASAQAVADELANLQTA